MRIVCALGAVLVVSGAAARPAGAAGDNAQADISVHVTPIVTQNVCGNTPDLHSAYMVTDLCPAAGERFGVWILVCNGSDSTGIAGMELGIGYDGAAGSGIDVDGWTLCADLDFASGGSDGQPTWPADGSGNVIVWVYDTNCQITDALPYVPNTVMAIGGMLDVTFYSPDRLDITPRAVSGRAKVAGCDIAEDDITDSFPSHLGSAGFCESGYNACYPGDPVKPTTWGRIKRGYE